MYCKHCNKQSPDNFNNCIYCGAPLETKHKRRHVPDESRKKTRTSLSFKMKYAIVMCAAVLIVISAVITGYATGSKPETVVKKMANSIESLDAKEYYSLFDEQVKLYKKNYIYYDDDETFAAITEPMHKSDEFYKKKCGEHYNIIYSVKSSEQLTGLKLEEYNVYLKETYGYKNDISDAVVLNVEFRAKGRKGEYTTVYDSFYCIKYKGKWYKSDELFSQNVQKSNAYIVN